MRLKLNKAEVKKFLLEKGERAALYACLGIMALMLIFGLFMPGKGVFSESATENARKLKVKNDEARVKMSTNKPDALKLAVLTIIPDELLRSGAQEQADPHVYRSSVVLWTHQGGEDSKRRQPKLLGPVEFAASMAQVPVSTFIFDKNVERIMVLRGGKGGVVFSEKARDNAKSLGKNFGQLKDKGLLKGGISGQAPRPENPGIGQPASSGPESPLTPQQKVESKVDWVKLEDLLKNDGLKDARLAEDLQSTRMAIIVGSFPLREQIRKFQQALRLRTMDQVFAENASLKGPQFQFLGLNVERRIVGSTRSEWTRINYENSYVPLVIRTGRRFVEDKAELKQVMYDGLVMQRPILPPGREDLYPEVELKLKTLQATLDELRKQNEEGKPTPRPDKRFSRQDFNIFGGATDEPEKEPEKPMTNPKEGAEWVPPEFCFIRFLDLDLESGKTYEYRVQIRMANPNFNHPHVAWPDLKVSRELVSEWFPVNDDQGKPIHVAVPPDAFFYVTDAKPTELGKHQVMVQFHRWLQFLTPPGNSETKFSVAEWVVAEHVPVNRGEYLRREDERIAPKIEVPIWMYTQGQFILANNPTAFYPNEKQRVPVPFNPGVGDYVLVDFQSGKGLSYTRRTDLMREPPLSNTVKDSAPVELLYLSPDGKLLVRDSENDRRDPERERRLQLYRDRVNEARGSGKGKDVPKKPGEGS